MRRRLSGSIITTRAALCRGALRSVDQCISDGTTASLPRSSQARVYPPFAFAVDYTFPALSARERIASAFEPVIPSAILEESAELLSARAHAKHGAHVGLFRYTDHTCVLCGTPTVDSGFSAHQQNYIHIARLGIVGRAVALVNWHLSLVFSPPTAAAVRAGQSRPYVFTPGAGNLPPAEELRQCPQQLLQVDWPEVLTQYWWRMIDVGGGEADSRLSGPSGSAEESMGLADFGRIPSLSSASTHRRRWRIRYLLRFLVSRQVLQDSLRLSPVSSAAQKLDLFTRTGRFERCEMIGDNIMKNVIRDRLLRLFPLCEGGLSGQLSLIQQTIDSNPGLLALYDYLKLDGIVGARLPNSKSKADVVEAIFGELHTVLWATELGHGADAFPALPDHERSCVRALVRHVEEELAHVAVMWRLEETLRNAEEFLKCCTVELRLQRSGAGGTGAHERRRGRPKIGEESIDRRPYDTLPLLTAAARSYPLELRSGHELYYHAQHTANTRAAGPQVLCGVLSPASIEGSLMWRRHYAKGALRVSAPADERRGAPGSEAAPGASESEGFVPLTSPATSRFPLWAAADRFRGQQHIAAAKLNTSLLSPAQLACVLEERMSALSASSRGTSPQQSSQNSGTLESQSCSASPDWSTSPRPPLYTSALAPHLVTSCLQTLWHPRAR